VIGGDPDRVAYATRDADAFAGWLTRTRGIPAVNVIRVNGASRKKMESAAADGDSRRASCRRGCASGCRCRIRTTEPGFGSCGRRLDGQGVIVAEAAIVDSRV
jgi:hypothetical protein